MPLIFNDHSYGVGRDVSSGAKARLRKYVTGLSICIFIVYILTGACVFIVLTPNVGNSEDPENPRRNTTFLDSIYFSTVTVTTVGYGDIVPENDAGKIFTSLYVLLSMALVAFMLDASNFLYEDNSVTESQLDLLTLKGLTNFITVSSSRVSSKLQLLYAMFILLVVIAVGTVFMIVQQGETVLDAIYFSIVSMSGIGYGDIKPTSDTARIFSIFYLVIGTFALFRAVGSALAVLIENRKHRWIERRARVLKELHEGSPKELKNLPREGLESIVTKDKYILWSLENKGVVTSAEVTELADDYSKIQGSDLEEEFTSDQGHRRARHLKRHTNWARLLSFMCLLVFLAYGAIGAAIYTSLNPEFGSKLNPLDPLTEITYLDSLYFVTVTLTTVGFGDITPTNNKSKVFLCVYILASLPLVAFMLDVTNFFDSLTHDDEFLERILKEKGLLLRGYEKDERDFASDNVKKARQRLLWSVSACIALIISGSLYFYFVDAEGLSAVDSFYFSVSAMSGVGYGDIVPATDSGKIFAIVWIGVGTFSLFRAVGAIVNVALESRIRAWEKKRERADDVDFEIMTANDREAEAEAFGTNNVVLQDLANLTDEALHELAMKQKFALWRFEERGKVKPRTIISLAEEFDDVEDISALEI